jgi:hypothetical protein
MREVNTPVRNDDIGTLKSNEWSTTLDDVI